MAPNARPTGGPAGRGGGRAIIAAPREGPTRYRCLILDHDDTAVDSTRRVHHPAHVEVMGRLRPGQPVADLDTWFAKNFDPGIAAYLEDELGMTEPELELEHRVWREFTARVTPQFYPGFLEALAVFRDRGGLISVVSHSESHVIRGHYEAAADGHRVLPDLIFGWELGSERRKPRPWPVQETLRRFALSPEEALVVDDLKPGVDMARAAGVDVAAAGWGHDIPRIRAVMRRECGAYLATVAEFAEFILR